MNETKDISMFDFYKYYQTNDDFKIIDVRDPNEYDAYHIHMSLNIPSTLLMEKHHLFISKNHLYFVVCGNGTRSKTVTNLLTKLGYTVINVLGGIERWPGLLVASKRYKF